MGFPRRAKIEHEAVESKWYYGHATTVLLKIVNSEWYKIISLPEVSSEVRKTLINRLPYSHLWQIYLLAYNQDALNLSQNVSEILGIV